MSGFPIRLKRFLFEGVLAVLLSFVLIGCIEVGKKKSSDDRLHCVFNDETVNKKKRTECTFVMDVSTSPKLSSMGVLKKELCNGQIGLYDDGSTQLGSDFHITNLKIVNQHTFTFHVVYAGTNGERVDVPGCTFVRKNGSVAYLYMGKGWPFSSEYQVTVGKDEIFAAKEEQKNAWYGFSLKKPYVADRYMYQIYSKYQWWFVAVFLLACALLVWNGAYLNLVKLVGVGGICFVSVTHDWTLAFPIVLPFFVALLVFLIPYVRSIALNVFLVCVFIGCLHAIGMLWHYYSFFMFIWKVVYIGYATIMSTLLAVAVFDGYCDKCGRFRVKGCYRRKEYFAAENVLSIPINSSGVMDDDSMPFINQYEDNMAEKCYWCDKD